MRRFPAHMGLNDSGAMVEKLTVDVTKSWSKISHLIFWGMHTHVQVDPVGICTYMSPQKKDRSTYHRAAIKRPRLYDRNPRLCGDRQHVRGELQLLR